MRLSVVLIGLGLGLTLGLPGSVQAVDPADKCESDKLKETGKYGLCRLKAESKAARTRGLPDFSKCIVKFRRRWLRVDAKGGEACLTSGDKKTMESEIDYHTDRIAEILSGETVPLCGNGTIEPGQECDFGDVDGETCEGLGFAYGALVCGTDCTFDTSGCSNNRLLDNGDGTVTDNATGLMWEKKTLDGSVHDMNNTYTWTGGAGGSTDPDGTAFTEFLGELNGCGYIEAGTITGGFAGYCDWRLPDVLELQTIVDCSFGPPCIDPILGPTVPLASWHWSSTAGGNRPTDAWIVRFDEGLVFPDFKSLDHFVRAVRRAP